jgi:hypothetical protein
VQAPLGLDRARASFTGTSAGTPSTRRRSTGSLRRKRGIAGCAPTRPPRERPRNAIAVLRSARRGPLGHRGRWRARLACRSRSGARGVRAPRSGRGGPRAPLARGSHPRRRPTPRASRGSDSGSLSGRHAEPGPHERPRRRRDWSMRRRGPCDARKYPSQASPHERPGSKPSSTHRRRALDATLQGRAAPGLPVPRRPGRPAGRAGARVHARSPGTSAPDRSRATTRKAEPEGGHAAILARPRTMTAALARTG